MCPEKAGKGSSENGREQVIERGAARPPGPMYWLIAKNENRRIKVLTIALAEGEEALPVFSFEEEARMYLGFEASGDGWRIRGTRAGELTSVLFGCCAHVGRVILDPLPQMATDQTVRPLTLDRKSFVRDLLYESELRGVATVASDTPKRRTTSLRGVPHSTAASTLSLRSFE